LLKPSALAVQPSCAIIRPTLLLSLSVTISSLQREAHQTPVLELLGLVLQGAYEFETCPDCGHP
jgi:hypothetical protein